MIKLFFFLLFFTNYCVYSQIQVQKSSVDVNNTTIRQRELVLTEPSTVVNVPLEIDLKNYETLMLVDISTYGESDKEKYNLYEERLISSPLKIVNPVKFDKKQFKENRLFLKNVKDPKSLYFYYVRGESSGNDDIVTTVVVRDYLNKVVYSVIHKNVSIPEILLPFTGF